MSLPNTDTSSFLGMAATAALWSLGSMLTTNPIDGVHWLTQILQNLAFLATIITGTLTSTKLIKSFLDGRKKH